MVAVNIFPGDMLLKNFEVTRHIRLVFYDYDGITYLTEYNFRDIPEALYPDQELAAEPWYLVVENEIFPEEFLVFLFPDVKVSKLFCQPYRELFTASYWRSVQEHIAQGQVMDMFSYRRSDASDNESITGQRSASLDEHVQRTYQ